MSNILITGKHGFIASYLHKSLGMSNNIIFFSKADGTDITRYDTLVAPSKKIDLIIHAAAVATDDFETAFQTNVSGTLNVCRYAYVHGIKRLILLSTIFALNESDNGYFNSYGKTKKMSEEIGFQGAGYVVLLYRYDTREKRDHNFWKEKSSKELYSY